MQDFGIAIGDAELVSEEGGEIDVPIKFRGVNKPQAFVTIFNNAKFVWENNLFQFMMGAWERVRKALKGSK